MPRMPRKRRPHFTPEEKAAILRRHLLDKVDIADLCAENDLQPSTFYGWRQQLFEDAALALQPKRRGRRDPQQRALEDQQRKAAELEEKVARKDHVIAVLAERLVVSEKANGEP